MGIQFMILFSVFIWMGFILAISFMEAWLKFRAPGVTIPIGLAIGKLVFRALNRIEWCLAVLISVCFLLSKAQPGLIALATSALVLLTVQTCWLLPALDKRAADRIEGHPVSQSSLHWYFVAAEFLKLIVLFVLGLCVFKNGAWF